MVDDDLLDGRVVHLAAAGPEAQQAVEEARSIAPGSCTSGVLVTAPCAGRRHPLPDQDPDAGLILRTGAQQVLLVQQALTSWRTSGRSTRSAARSVGDTGSADGGGPAPAARPASYGASRADSCADSCAGARAPRVGPRGALPLRPARDSGHPATSPSGGPAGAGDYSPGIGPSARRGGGERRGDVPRSRRTPFRPHRGRAGGGAVFGGPAPVGALPTPPPRSAGRRRRAACPWGPPTSGPQALARPAGPRSEPGGDGARARGEAPLPRRPPGVSGRPDGPGAGAEATALVRILFRRENDPPGMDALGQGDQGPAGPAAVVEHQRALGGNRPLRRPVVERNDGTPPQD